jgi:hypothetical protein
MQTYSRVSSILVSSLKQAMTTVSGGRLRSMRSGGGRSISNEAIRFALR